MLAAYDALTPAEHATGFVLGVRSKSCPDKAPVGYGTLLNAFAVHVSLVPLFAHTLTV
jgi:hypothetical protein